MKGHCKICGRKLPGKKQAEYENFTCNKCCDAQHAAWKRTKAGREHGEAMSFWNTWCR